MSERRRARAEAHSLLEKERTELRKETETIYDEIQTAYEEALLDLGVEGGPDDKGASFIEKWSTLESRLEKAYSVEGHSTACARRHIRRRLYQAHEPGGSSPTCSATKTSPAMD
jgi:hypothetical protein